MDLHFPGVAGSSPTAPFGERFESSLVDLRRGNLSSHRVGALAMTDQKQQRKRGRKSHAETRPLVIFLAQKIWAAKLSGGRRRPLREVATLLAKAGHGTKKMEVGDATIDRAFPFGPSSIQKMIATKLSLSDDELRHCEALWSRCKLDILSGNSWQALQTPSGTLKLGI